MGAEHNEKHEVVRKYRGKNGVEKDGKMKSLADITREEIPFPPPNIPSFRFVDLFSGIGGFRLALQDLGGKCVFSSEIDKYAAVTYRRNFGDLPAGDIREIDERAVPDHDILAAGFPCQAFSIAGKRGGFEDARGTLFFEIARIIREKKPKAFILENVKGLVSHDKGRTLKTILEILRVDLGYTVPPPKILNAADFGLPQNRQRIIIVGFREDLDGTFFAYPKPSYPRRTIGDILEEKPVSAKYYLSDVYLKSLRRHRARHESKGHGFGYEVRDSCDVANAIVIGGMGKERNLVTDTRLKNPEPVTRIKGKVNEEFLRRMTPREWARLQGFPDKFVIPVSDVQAYRQFANAVPVPVIRSVADNVIRTMGRKADAPQLQ